MRESVNKLKKRYGFTLAEILLTVGIVLILTAVAFVSVHRYQRSLGQLERDGIAKEIFVAAQNHLSVAYGEGYLGVVNFGTEYPADSGLYYCVSDGSFPENSIIGQMLPYGAIDDTVRAGGSIIIYYQKETGTVLDVFYCTKSGGNNTFNHTLTSGEIEGILGLRGDGSKEGRRTYAAGGNSILGWYGGTAAATLHTVKLKPPTIKIVNAEKLYVEVTDTNTDKPDGKIKIVVKGVTSKAEKTIVLSASDDRVKVISSGTSRSYTVILDDVTTANMHFANLTADAGTGTFKPGEDIEVTAIAYSSSALANIAYSAAVGSNSLFGSFSTPSGGVGTATIGNFRHLENLDRSISNLHADIAVAKAEQTVDLSWKDFRQKIRNIESTKENYSPGDPDTVIVNKWNGGSTAAKVYMPIEPDYALTYEGKNHSVTDVYVRSLEKAGLFGATTSGTVIKDLELLDFDIQGTSYAGTLAATTTSATVTNVIARYSDPSTLLNPVKAPTAGGLIGSMSGGSVNYSGAIMTVEATGTAGGLIGTSSGDVTGCYSSGRTKDAAYKKWIDTLITHAYDVTGATAGGLIGAASSGTINSSYTTCSVAGSTLAGGFAGSAGSSSITNSYSTGLIKPKGTRFAFVGSGSLGSLSGDYYYSIINEEEKTDAKWEKKYELLLPIAGYNPETNTASITGIDQDLQTYNTFVGDKDNWNAAMAYDSKLVEYYDVKYNLQTVKQLCGDALPTGYDSWGQLFVSLHYGDWPAPEILTINQ